MGAPKGKRVGLAGKLAQLGASGTARLKSAWDDAEVSTGDVERRFALQTGMVAEIKALWGPKAKPSPGSFSFGAIRIDRRNA